MSGSIILPEPALQEAMEAGLGLGLATGLALGVGAWGAVALLDYVTRRVWLAYKRRKLALWVEQSEESEQRVAM